MEIDLEEEITNALNRFSLLANGGQMFAPHPIVRGGSVTGKHVVHTPSYSQRNGRLYVMEHIDLETRRISKAKERAGWIGYMFSDIKNFDENMIAYSLIRPARDGGGEQIEYAKSVLERESSVINWSDDADRGRFLEERKIVAGTIPTMLGGF
jgi:hypothetical protein